MSVLTIGYSFSMKILHNFFKLDMKKFMIVRNLLYVTACLTKLHIIARCIAEQTVGVRVGWAKIFTGPLFKHGLLFFWKAFQTRPLFKQALIKQGPLFECIRYLCFVSNGRYNVCLCRLGFNSKSIQIRDFNISYHSFPAWCSAINGQCGEQAGKFTCVIGKN